MWVSSPKLAFSLWRQLVQVAMISTMIIIVLVGVTIFWKAPFSIAPVYRLVHHRWRWILFIALLLTLFTAQSHTHTRNSAANLMSKKCLEKCKAS